MNLHIKKKHPKITKRKIPLKIDLENSIVEVNEHQNLLKINGPNKNQITKVAPKLPISESVHNNCQVKDPQNNPIQTESINQLKSNDIEGNELKENICSYCEEYFPKSSKYMKKHEKSCKIYSKFIQKISYNGYECAVCSTKIVKEKSSLSRNLMYNHI